MTVVRVPPLEKPERLDLFLSRALGLTRARVQSLLEAGHILLRGRIPDKAGVKLKGGEDLDVTIPPPPQSGLKKENIPLEILYEDEALLVLNKPAGLVVHPAAGHWEGTLVNALLYHFESLSSLDPARPGIVHRLDKDTSGILLVAKNDKAHLELSRQFREREMEKIYAVLVHGVMAHDEGVIDRPIGRHPVNRKKMAVVAKGRPALTRYKVIRRFKDCTFLECKIETGRTHQIRVHLSCIGHPVLGDPAYGRSGDELERQMLHAWKMKLKHPVTGEMLALEAPFPLDMKEWLDIQTGGTRR